ncbi:MAG: PAS-domain containing protein [Geminicoccaceae bacterium]
MDFNVSHNQALLDFAVGQSPAIFYVSDTDGENPVRFISPNVEAITGHKPDAFLKDPNYRRRLIHPDDRPGLSEIQAQLGKHGTQKLEYRFATRSGAYMWFRDEARIVEGSDGKQCVGCMVDVTAEKEALTRLEQAEAHSGRTAAPKENGQHQSHALELVRRVLDASPVPIRVTDPDDGRILYESPASTRAYGAPAGQAPDSALAHYADRSDRARYIEALRESGQIDDREVRLRRWNGEEFQASVSARIIEYEGDEIVVSSAFDLTEQKAREAELRQARETLEDAIESLSEGFALYDDNDRLVICNEQYRDFHQFGSDLLVPGVNWVDLMRTEADRGLYVDAVGRTEEWVQDRIRARRAFRSHLEYEQSDGRWIEGSNQPTRQGGTVVTLSDITERKKREAELREAREILEDAIEALSEGFALFDAEGRLVRCNSKYREYNPAIRDDIEPGLKWSEFQRMAAERGQYPEAVGRLEEWHEERLQNRRARRRNVVHRQSDGRWYEFSTHDMRGGGHVVTKWDITRQKQAEQALRESQALVTRVLDACPVPITMNCVDDGTILYESPAAKALYYRGEPGSTGAVSTLQQWARPSDRDAYVAQLRAQASVDGLEVEFKKADGTIFWALESARLIEYQGEDVVVSTALDLTERKAIEAEVARQREVLHQAEKLSALGELLAGVSHELNNPLSVLVGQALLLKETAADPAIIHRAEKIGDAADRCARIVKSFLAMARQQPAEARAVDVNEVIEPAIEVTAYALRSADIELVLELDPQLPPVMVDPDQFGQVVTNLIVNAEHALDEIDGRRRLAIETRHLKYRQLVELRVADNGPGVPEDLQSRIFEPLFTTKDVGSGTGIGLALCHRIVESHGGKIEVESVPGKGATFIVRLPCATADITDEREPIDIGSEITGSRVLLIDDEPDVAAVLADILRKDGHATRIAYSGEDALHLLTTESFDVILSDLRMPHMDGPTLYWMLERERPELISKMAFMTGATLGQKARDFLRTADRPFIEKPFTPEDVRELLKRVSGGS